MIKPNFTQADIQKYFDDAEERIEAAILHQLRYVAVGFVANARKNGMYQDQTGNLRNSVGYIILKNGQIVDGNFTGDNNIVTPKKKRTVNGKSVVNRQYGLGDAKSSAETGKEVAASIAAQYPTGYALICVAGMHYAAAVESKGYDVITGSAKQAKKDLSQALRRILKRL